MAFINDLLNKTPELSNPYILAQKNIILGKVNQDFETLYEGGFSIENSIFGKNFAYACVDTLLKTVSNENNFKSYFEVIKKYSDKFFDNINKLNQKDKTFAINVLRNRIQESKFLFNDQYNSLGKFSQQLRVELEENQDNTSAYRTMLLLFENTPQFQVEKLTTKEDIKRWLIDNVVSLSSHVKFNILSDLSISVEGDVAIKGRRNKLPVKFNSIKGHFLINDMGLTTLEGCPDFVEGNFDCSGNRLKSLEHGPKTVHGLYNFSHNKVKSLIYGPHVVKKSIIASFNPIENTYEIGTEFEGYFYLEPKGETHLKTNREGILIVNKIELENFNAMIIKERIKKSRI